MGKNAKRFVHEIDRRSCRIAELLFFLLTQTQYIITFHRFTEKRKKKNVKYIIIITTDMIGEKKRLTVLWRQKRLQSVLQDRQFSESTSSRHVLSSRRASKKKKKIRRV